MKDVNRMTVTELQFKGQRCEIDWCDHEAHYNLAVADDDKGDFCARHFQTMVQSLVDATESAFHLKSEGVVDA